LLNLLIIGAIEKKDEIPDEQATTTTAG
jgi:hypothetical protein